MPGQRLFSPCAAYSLVAPLAWLRELAYGSGAATIYLMCSVTSSVKSRCTSTGENLFTFEVLLLCQSNQITRPIRAHHYGGCHYFPCR